MVFFHPELPVQDLAKASQSEQTSPPLYPLTRQHSNYNSFFPSPVLCLPSGFTQQKTWHRQDFLVDRIVHGSTAEQPQTITLPTSYLTVGMMLEWFVSFTPDVMRCMPSRNCYFRLMSQQNIIPKVMGPPGCFWQMWDKSSCPFCQQWCAPCNSPISTSFTRYLSYWGITNIDLNWNK